MTRYIGLLVFVSSLSLSLCGYCWAQGSPPGHTHPAVTVVDGASNPDLISDSTAYRVWLVAVSIAPDSTEKQRRFQEAHLRRVRLTSSVDYIRLLVILGEFKSQYQTLVTAYNESAKNALLSGSHADLQAFLQRRDDLVSTTRAAIAQRLTPEGAALVDAHVRGEKRHIQIHTTGSALP